MNGKTLYLSRRQLEGVMAATMNLATHHVFPTSDGDNLSPEEMNDLMRRINDFRTPKPLGDHAITVDEPA